jgi:transcriptional regulator with XRE-family HTH domain
VSHGTLARLKKQLKARGITHERVAEAAGVGRTLVVHVLAGRAKSANVVATAKRLLIEQAPVEPVSA